MTPNRSFSLDHAILFPPKHPERVFSVAAFRPLRDVLAAGELDPQVGLQVVEREEAPAPMAFLTRDLLLFDAAQGTTQGKPWLVTFCPICNAGMMFSPQVGEQRFTFVAGGIYNAMALLRDLETGSYWNHIHGTCLHGPSVGLRLPHVTNLRHMTAAAALTAHPDLVFARPPLSAEDEAQALEDDAWRQAQAPTWSPRLVATLTAEDTRLPRLDMGLGLWNEAEACYYPLASLYLGENYVQDTFNGRQVLVYIDPDTGIPDAFYTEAQASGWMGDSLLLSNGWRIEQGSVWDKTGQPVAVERPLQLFQRWYGFSLMFPNCAIYRS